MKQIFLTLLLLSGSSLLYIVSAQISTNQNYIVKITPLDATDQVTISNGQVQVGTGIRTLTTVEYFDGLGRPVETVRKGFTPSKKDLVTIQTYDSFGRDSAQILPTPYNSNGAFVPVSTILPAARSFYGDQKPYTKPEYEQSPLNRIQEQYGPGESWQNNGKAVKTAYMTNNTSANLLCASYIASMLNDSLILKKTGNYAGGQLYVTEIKDEDGNTFYEFKDKLGRLILTRQINGTSERLNTYYVYDDYGNLTFVLPPLASDKLTAINVNWKETNDAIKKYAYLYRYDHRNRCIAKRIPGCDWIKYQYDKADRLIFWQDGELRSKGSQRWFFSIPDVLGRPLVTGVVNYLTVNIQNTLVTGEFVGNISGTIIPTGYKISPSSGYMIAEIHTVNYYDNYTFKGKTLSVFNTVNFQYGMPSGFEDKRYGTDSDLTSAKGQLTGRVTALFGQSTLSDPNKYTASIYYYDDKGRTVQSVSSNYLGGYNKESTNYSFSGQPTKTELYHQTSAGTTSGIKETYVYTYDHADRLLKTTHQVNSQTSTTMSTLSYDEVGRSSQKTLHAGMESITYKYNVRSWLKSISSNLFIEELYYNESFAGNTPAYNGNISTMTWRHGLASTKRGYNFKYDNLNRLLMASFLLNDAASGLFNEQYQYDKMGNIINLSRMGNSSAYLPGSSEPVDLMSLGYNGNQLSYISDSYPSKGFLKPYGQLPPSGMNEYAYNTNGAMTHDFNRQISGIQYNALNLPQHIQFSNGHSTDYVYDAAGVKQKAVHTTLKNVVTVPLGTTTAGNQSGNIANTLTTDYCGHIIYENNAVKYIRTPEGYLTPESGGKYNYNYYLRDHLGNNRLVLTWNGGSPPNNYYISQEMHYYPSGMPFVSNYSGDIRNPGAQPYKFGDKEYDMMHGLNWYDFEARMRDGMVPVFPTPDPLSEKYYSTSQYAYCLNNPIRNIDPNGMEVYMLFYTNGDARFKSAAETRQREIEGMEGFDKTKDHVYIQELGDLGTLGDRVSGIVKDATDNGYGLTAEASFWSHSGYDGPRADVGTSGDYKLDDIGGNQMTGEGWSNINWNFNSENSVAAFYGCNSASFAEKFLDYQPSVAYTAGQGGGAGPSYSTGKFDDVSGWRSFGSFSTSKNIYYGTRSNGQFYGPSVYSRKLGVDNYDIVKGNVSIIKGKLQNVIK